MRVLFITHETSRSGAPILLLKLIDWLKTTKEVHPTILSIKGGDLNEEFQEQGTLYTWNNNQDKSWGARIERAIKKDGSLSRKQRQILKRLRNEQFDLIYINSVVSLQLLEYLIGSVPDCPVLLHVHELDTIIEQNQVQDLIKCDNITRYIAVSNIVRDNLIDQLNISERKIDKVREYVDLKDWNDNSPKKPAHRFVVSGIGTVHWRKGVELFVLVADKICNKHQIEDIDFVWLGKISENDRIYLQKDLEKLKLNSRVKFQDELTDLSEYYNSVDVLLITSREDPYPTVAIEAGIHGIPFVCWNQGIGTSELADQHCGIAVDYLNTDEMADAIVKFKKDSALWNRFSENIREKAKSHDINIAGEKIYSVMKDCLA